MENKVFVTVRKQPRNQLSIKEKHQGGQWIRQKCVTHSLAQFDEFAVIPESTDDDDVISDWNWEAMQRSNAVSSIKDRTSNGSTLMKE